MKHNDSLLSALHIIWISIYMLNDLVYLNKQSRSIYHSSIPNDIDLKKKSNSHLDV